MSVSQSDVLIKRALYASVFLGVVAGLGFGIGSYTFVYAKGFSYITNDPAACANCHVMQEYLDGWAKSSHHAVAVCNDCHTPHTFFGKYYVKGMNGFHHSLAFTTGNFPDRIQIKPGNRAVAESSCRYCHAEMVQQIDSHGHGPESLDCIWCHTSVGHIK